jgi:hypothetical protein
VELAADSRLGVVDFREQILLQAQREVVHWGFRRDATEQTLLAVSWLKGAANRRVLIPKQLAESCFEVLGAQSMGYRHRRDWLLLKREDIDTAKCRYPLPGDASYYVSPALSTG